MLYVIPGFEHSGGDEQYVQLFDALKMDSVHASLITIDWRTSTIDQWIAQAEEQLHDWDRSDLLLGFSIGAMIALQVARTKPMGALFLYSLSPYYAGYLETLPKSWARSFGPQRWTAFSKYSLTESAHVLSEKVYLFVGEKEAKQFPSLKKTAEDLHRLLPASSVTIVPGAEHEIGHREYIAAITRTVTSL